MYPLYHFKTLCTGPTVANTVQLYPIPFHIAEDDSVTFYWIDLFPSASCVTSVNASLEYRMFREPVPVCPDKHDGYVLSSAETILNQTIMYSPLNSSVCDDRVISIPLSCGGRLTSTAVSSNAVVVVHSSADVDFSVFERSSLKLKTTFVRNQTSAVLSTAVSTAIFSSSAHSTSFQTSSVHSTVLSTAIHSSFKSSSFHSTAIHSSTSIATTVIPTSIPQSMYMHALFFL